MKTKRKSHDDLNAEYNFDYSKEVREKYYKQPGTKSSKGILIMEMSPACGKTSNMVSSTSMRARAGSSGENKWIKTISFHCEQCRQFVRSEDREEAAGYRKSAIPVGVSATLSRNR